MSSNQYRVWDTGHEAFVDHILIAQDGRLLLNLDDLLVPSIEPERYIVERATGYLDTKDKMIYDADIVHNNWEEANFLIAWGNFGDCGVEGETWILKPESYQPAMDHWCDNGDKENRDLTVVGNIHETPELLDMKEPG